VEELLDRSAEIILVLPFRQGLIAVPVQLAEQMAGREVVVILRVPRQSPGPAQRLPVLQDGSQVTGRVDLVEQGPYRRHELIAFVHATTLVACATARTLFGRQWDSWMGRGTRRRNWPMRASGWTN
jgi:hypothetical protein